MWESVTNALLMFFPTRPLSEFDFQSPNTLIGAGATSAIFDLEHGALDTLYLTGWGFTSSLIGSTPMKILCNGENVLQSNGPGNRILHATPVAGFALEVSPLSYRHKKGPHRLQCIVENTGGVPLNVTFRLKGHIAAF